MIYTFRLNSTSDYLAIDQPADFDNIRSKLRRDFDAHGLFFEFTDPSIKLKFPTVDKSREFLEDAFQLDGVDADVTLNVDFQQDEFDSPTQIYDGQIDFESRALTDDYFECIVNVESVALRLKNNMKIPVSMTDVVNLDGDAIDPLVPTQVQLHSKRFLKTTQWEQDADQFAQAVSIPTSSPWTNYGLLGMNGKIKDEIDDQFDYAWSVTTTNPTGASQYLYKFAEPGAFTAPSILMQFQCVFDMPGTTFAYDIALYYKLGSGSETQIGPTSSASGISVLTTVTHTVASFNTDFGTVAIDDEFFFYLKVIITPVGLSLSSQLDITNRARVALGGFPDVQTDIEFNLQTEAEVSQANGYRSFDALEHWAKVVLPSTSEPLHSDLMSFYAGGCLNDLFLFSGYNIRNFDSSERPLIIKFRDWFAAFNSMFAVGYGLENDKLRVEKFTYFYSGAEILDFGTVDNIEWTVFNELVANEFEIGFKKYANDEDEFNSLEDFHTQSSWRLPLSKVSKSIKKISPWLMSAFLIETTRREGFAEKASTSFKYDDDIFMIQTLVPDSSQQGSSDAMTFTASNDEIKITAEQWDEVVSLGTCFEVTDTVSNDGTFTYDPELVFTTEVDEQIFYHITVDQNITVNEDLEATVSVCDTNQTRVAERDQAMGPGVSAAQSGLSDRESHYNLRYTLKRSMADWGKYLNSVMAFKSSSEEVKRTDFRNNPDYTSQIISTECSYAEDQHPSVTLTYVEGDNEPIARLDYGLALFYPEAAKFTVKLTFDQIELIKNAHAGKLTEDDEGKNYGWFTFVDRCGIEFTAYMMEMNWNPINQQCEFVLLRRNSYGT